MTTDIKHRPRLKRHPEAVKLLAVELTRLTIDHYSTEAIPVDPETNKPCPGCVRTRQVRRELEDLRRVR